MTDLKMCSKCGQTLPVEEFSCDIRSKDGLQHYCKECFARYKRQWRANIEVRERQGIWYAQWLEKRPGYRKEYDAKRPRRFTDPGKLRARARITRLIQSGKIPSARDCSCVTCGKPATEYHHYRGYAREHQDDVIPVCRSCHRRHHSQYDWKLCKKS